LARKVQVKQVSLNVRSGPGENFPAVDRVKQGQAVQIFREVRGWGEISEERWIALIYTDRA
jgi:uncharacterized protein YraI